MNKLCYILIISIFNFLIFIHFTNQITLKPSLAQKLKLIFKFSTIMEQINVPLWTHMGHKGWRKNGKTFIRCYTIALKFWDEFNANFVSLYFSGYDSIKMWPLYLKNVEENNEVKHLRLVLTLLFCVFQTNVNKAVSIFCRLPKWIRNVQMIPGFSIRLGWERGWKSQ